MGNEATKQQIKEFLRKAVEKAQNPDKREELRRLRARKAQRIAKNYGL